VVLFLSLSGLKRFLMKFLSVTVSLLLLGFGSSAQGLHLNLFAGMSNYQGDLQSKILTLNEAHLAVGAGFSYDLSDHFSIRSAVTFAKVSGADKYTDNKARNLSFASAISEGQLGLEYYIMPLGTHSLTPYLFTSVAVFHFNPYTFDTTGKKYYLKDLSTEGEGFVAGRNEYKLTQFAIPIGAGVKLSLSDNVNVGIEMGFRKAFTDYLDDVSSTYVDRNLLLTNRGAKAVELAYRGGELKNGDPQYPAAGTQRGASAQKDWYYFTGLTLSFRLNGGGFGGNGKHSEYRCPANVR
jgi:opacity protein-like surface antigen